MSLYGAFDSTKHFDELDTPLATAEGVLTPAQRRARVIANLFVDGDALTLANDMTFSGVVDITGGDTNITTTSAAVANIEPLVVQTTISGAGATGGRALFRTDIDGAAGGWSNALKSYASYGAAGSTSGLGSSFVAEMDLSAGTSAGTYAPIEIELNLGTGALTGTTTSLFYASINGDDAATFDDNGYLFNITGITEGNADFFNAHTLSNINEVTHGLRVKVDGADYYILMAAQAAFVD